MFPIATKPCEFMVNAMWAYSAFTRDNGATIVVPGSHTWDPQRVPREEEITQAEMDPGDVLIYLGSLIHAGGANTSAEPRTGIALSYCLGWIRQSENQYFAVPPSLAKAFSKELQDLLGYCVQRPNLGMVEGNEPSILFTDTRPFEPGDAGLVDARPERAAPALSRRRASRRGLGIDQLRLMNTASRGARMPALTPFMSAIVRFETLNFRRMLRA